MNHRSSIFSVIALSGFFLFGWFGLWFFKSLLKGRLLLVWTEFYETVKRKTLNFVSLLLEVTHRIWQIAWEGVLAPCNLKLINCAHKHEVSFAFALSLTRYPFLQQPKIFFSVLIDQKLCITTQNHRKLQRGIQVTLWWTAAFSFLWITECWRSSFTVFILAPYLISTQTTLSLCPLLFIKISLHISCQQ